MSKATSGHSLPRTAPRIRATSRHRRRQRRLAPTRAGHRSPQVILQQEIVPDPVLISGSGRSHSTTVRAVRTDTTNTTPADPEQLREALVSFIDGFGTFRSTQVKDAFRTVPRHLFLPGVDLTTAYAPKPVVTRRAEDGTAVSSASSPHVVATMLEQLDVAPGHRVLEIGAATGINAALLAELVGPTGTVVTIELDDDLAAGARASLTATGYDQVEVICGDGALGHPARAPYDRIIVTAGTWDIVDVGHRLCMVAPTRRRRPSRRAATPARQRPHPLDSVRPRTTRSDGQHQGSRVRFRTHARRCGNERTSRATRRRRHPHARHR
jgi:protein-L-isoaspartate(D-aspartate) O-methyltransferase